MGPSTPPPSSPFPLTFPRKPPPNQTLFRASNNNWTRYYEANEMRDAVGGVPYGWFYDGGCRDCQPDDRVHDYPVFFDVNFNATRKQQFVTLLDEGGYVDAQTSKITFQMPLMSYEFGSFTLVRIDFQPAPGGGWEMAYDVTTLDPNLRYPYPFQTDDEALSTNDRE